MADFTVEDLAEFTGRDVSEYSDFTATAIKQALILFKLATCLDDVPTDGPFADLAKFAVLAMASSINTAQVYADELEGPFQSQSIGSYSYSIAASKISTGSSLGIPWFDMAVRELGVCHLKNDGYGADIPMFGGIEMYDNYAPVGVTDTPNVYRHFTDAERQESSAWGFVIPNGGG